jgi:hypothetical protein
MRIEEASKKANKRGQKRLGGGIDTVTISAPRLKEKKSSKKKKKGAKTNLEVSLDNAGRSLTNVKHVIVGWLPVILGNTIKIGNSISEGLCELALASSGHESVLDRLVIP